MENEQKKKMVLKIFWLLGLTLALGVGFWFGKKTVKSQIKAPVEIPIAEKEWTLPEAKGRIVPVVKEMKLWIYDRENNKSLNTGIKTSWGSGASGRGEDNPLLSPDEKYVAFINENDGRKLYLWVAGNDRPVKVSNYAVDYLTDWAPDSQKILFYSSDWDNIKNRKQAEMGGVVDWNREEYFDKNHKRGFQVFDLLTGKETDLYPVVSAEGFVDNERIWMLEQNEESKDKFVVFNVDTFKTEYGLVDEVIPFGGHQITFDREGKYWAFMDNDDQSGTNGKMKIKTGIFPDRNGTLLTEANWAMAQMPRISPDGKFIVFEKRGEQTEPGRYKNLVVIWNRNTGKETRTISGTARYWVDNQTIFVLRSPDGGTNVSAENGEYVLVNVVNGEEVVLE